LAGIITSASAISLLGSPSAATAAFVDLVGTTNAFAKAPAETGEAPVAGRSSSILTEEERLLLDPRQYRYREYVYVH
jgi:hypothetical protein